MKRAFLLITLSVLLHLLVIDLTFYVIATGEITSIFALSAYNLVWLSIALIVGSQSYKESRGN